MGGVWQVAELVQGGCSNIAMCWRLKPIWYDSLQIDNCFFKGKLLPPLTSDKGKKTVSVLVKCFKCYKEQTWDLDFPSYTSGTLEVS